MLTTADAHSELQRMTNRYKSFPSAVAAVVSELVHRGAGKIEIRYEKRDGLPRLRILGIGAVLTSGVRDAISNFRFTDLDEGADHHSWVIALGHHAMGLAIVTELSALAPPDKTLCLSFECHVMMLAFGLALRDRGPHHPIEWQEIDRPDLTERGVGTVEVLWNGLGLGQGVNVMANRSPMALEQSLGRFLSPEILDLIEIIYDSRTGEEVRSKPRTKSLTQLPETVNVWGGGDGSEDIRIKIVSQPMPNRLVDLIEVNGEYIVEYHFGWTEFHTPDERANRYQLAFQIALSVASHFGKDYDLYRFEALLENLLGQLYPK